MQEIRFYAKRWVSHKSQLRILTLENLNQQHVTKAKTNSKQMLIEHHRTNKEHWLNLTERSDYNIY